MIKHSITCVLAALSITAPSFAGKKEITLTQIGRYTTGVFAAGACEIAAHDPKTQRLFVVNAASSSVEVIDINNPAAPTLVKVIDLTPYGDQANSVDFHHGVLATAVQAEVKTNPGKVVFFDADGNFINSVEVGALPDMLTYTPDGRYVLVANEGEPASDYSIDPEGSISVIDLKRGADRVTQADVATAGFGSFNLGTLDSSVRIFGPGATVAQDLEPEYITVSHDSKTAWVTLQENNALAIVDIRSGEVLDIVGLGFKDHSLPGNAFDPSDRDSAVNGGINIANWPVYGMYLPDAIASFRAKGRTYLITANEGDARDYSAFAEEARVSSLSLDPTAFPNGAFLKNNARLGRLSVTKTLGDSDGDGDYDALYSFGGRSFSIWNADGSLVFDSGDDLEQLTAALLPSVFNSDHESNGSRDTRSDNKGPEPEAVTVGEVKGETYAFIGLERMSGIVVYNVSNPAAPEFVQYVNPRDFAGNAAAGTAGDLGPEGLHFIPNSESPTGDALLVVANEISGSVSIYSISKVK
ncbi:MAG: choice-of-anchor I family protein [Verrucomicrobiota bacterium]|nr:choice-of-anchor I family protein [Verrucomicrobiota bacterium]